MKSYYSVVVLFFTIISTGQSKHHPKLELTNSTLKNFSISKQYVSESQILDKNQEQLINFNKVMSFKDENDYLSVLTNLNNLSQLTVFTVYQSENDISAQDVWKIYGEDSFVSLSTSHANNSDMYLDYQSEFKKEPLLNTYTQMYRPKKATNFHEEAHILLGSFSNGKDPGFRGSIAEIVVYNKVLRGKKKQIIETALALKYGITLTNGKDYLSSSKEKIYNIKDNNNFAYRIAGIGRDDKNSLLQKQSHSTKENSLITIGLGDIAATNEENNIELNNQTFIIWGDNNQEPIIDLKNQISQVSLMSRKWKIQVTGKSVSELSTIVEFNCSEILREEGEVNDYVLVIDPNGDGNFLSETVKYINVSTSENNSLTFNNIKWDEDGSGSDLFTFILKSELELILEEVAPLDCENNNSGALLYKVNGGMPPYQFELSKDAVVIDHWKSTNNKYPKNHIEELAEGNYTLRVIDALQKQTDVKLVLSSPEPISINLGDDRRLRLDDPEIVLDASIAVDEEIDYIWSSNNGFTSNSPQIQISQPGIYTITATTKSGCIASDTINIEDSIIKSFIVYPNQSRDGNYNIQVKLSQKEDITIKVFDMSGRYLSTIEGKNKSIYSISGNQIFRAGIYNIVLESASQNEFRKLIVD